MADDSEQPPQQREPSKAEDGYDAWQPLPTKLVMRKGNRRRRGRGIVLRPSIEPGTTDGGADRK